MLMVTLLLILLAACSGPNRPPPQAASAPIIDTEFALREIDPTLCPEYAGALAITKDGLSVHLQGDVRFRKSARDALIGEQRLRELATEQRDTALATAQHNEWWARWGVWVGVGGTLLTVAAALAAGAAIAAGR